MSKKICILSTVNIRHMTLISVYTRILKKKNINFDIIYMDKYGEAEHFDSDNIYKYTNIIRQEENKIKKVFKYFKFRKYAIDTITQNNYDFIIVWNDITAFMFADFLSKEWDNRYCLNLRDYAGQKYRIVFNRFKKVIEASSFTTISSPSYKSFLPSYEYVHFHSFNADVLSEVLPNQFFRKKELPIRISFIGNIRFLDMNEKLLTIFKNDERFILQYFGTNATKLHAYAVKNRIRNLTYHDTFPVSMTQRFIDNTDLVNNLYGSNDISLNHAISIKLYHGIYKRTPLLVMEGTYMAEIIRKYNIGYVVDKINDSLPDKIYNWYNQLNFEEFNLSCEQFLEKTQKENEHFEKSFSKMLDNI